MKYQLAKPFLFLIAFILIFGLACSLTGPSTPAPQPTIPVAAPVQQAAASPVPPPTTIPPTVASPPTAVPPTQPPAPANAHFYTEEFDGNLDNWDYFYFGDDGADYNISTKDGRLVFDIKDEDLYIYDIYYTENYDNVRIETEVNNRGFNNNNVSLICRFDPDEGWYEFNIANNGLYNIYAYDILGDTGYNIIADGGANNIKMGKETNHYSIVCNGKTLTLYINGKEIKSVQENKFGFNGGNIGVSVSSFGVVPINVEFEWLKISEP